MRERLSWCNLLARSTCQRLSLPAAQVIVGVPHCSATGLKRVLTVLVELWESGAAEQESDMGG